MRSFAGVFFVVSLALSSVYAAGPTCKDATDLDITNMYPSTTTDITVKTNLTCGKRTYSSYGEWYTFVGDSQVVTIDTCDTRTNFDTVVMVFQGCEQNSKGQYDECLVLDDDGCSGKASTVTFLAEAMHTYYVFVGGVNDERGTYYLSTAYANSPESHTCDKAVEIQNFPTIIYSNTTLNRPVRDECLNTASSGMWFKLFGGGLPVMAHTCNYKTDFDTIIELYGNCSAEGEASGCIMYNNDACYKQSLITWDGEWGNFYWIFVTGLANARGNFELSVEHQTYRPNGVCTDPVSITAIPFHWRSNTAYLEQTKSECRGVSMNAMWFRVHGAGRKLIATTCDDDNHKGDTVIDVYRHCNVETREADTCVASNDDYCGVNAAVIFDTVTDEYYIAVSSYSQGVNGVNFSLSVTAYDDTNNSLCWNAKTINNLPSDLSGTTRDREPSLLTCEGTSTGRRGAFYRYDHVGPAKTITASTCNRQNILAATLELYEDCNQNRCNRKSTYDPKTGCTELSFNAEDGKTYNLFVTAANESDPGSYYHVDFYEDVPDPASNCTSAYEFPRGSLPLRIENYTGKSTLSWSSCYNEYRRGVWVQVVGTGGKMIATTCNDETDFDTQLELYGACPEKGAASDYCIAKSDDDPHCGYAATLSWASDKNALYWIFVSGFADRTGIFVLNVYDKEDPINSQCTNAKAIEKLPYTAYGITTYANPSKGDCIENTPRKGIWYEIIGSGRWVTVDTCDAATTFATEIEIYTDCTIDDGASNCVAHAHDLNCTPHTVITFAAEKGKRYFIFITGDASGVFAEGEYIMKVTEGAKLPDNPSSSGYHGGGGGNVFGKIVGYYVLVMVIIGIVCMIGAVIYGRYRKHNIEYQTVEDAH